MNIGVIAKRYAKALLEYATEKQCEEVVYQETQRFIGIYRQRPELREILDNPLLSSAAKTEAICRSAADDASEVFRKFAALVVSRRRASVMLFIAHAYIILYRESKRISIGKLTTAVPIEDKIVERLKDTVEKQLRQPADLIIETRVDPRLIGGFIFAIDDYQLDASVATQFERIKKQFIEQNKRIV